MKRFKSKGQPCQFRQVLHKSIVQTAGKHQAAPGRPRIITFQDGACGRQHGGFGNGSQPPYAAFRISLGGIRALWENIVYQVRRNRLFLPRFRVKPPGKNCLPGCIKKNNIIYLQNFKGGIHQVALNVVNVPIFHKVICVIPVGPVQSKGVKPVNFPLQQAQYKFYF